MQGSPISKMGAAAPGVVSGIRPRGLLPPFHKRANAAGGILMMDQGQGSPGHDTSTYNKVSFV